MLGLREPPVPSAEAPAPAPPPDPVERRARRALDSPRFLLLVILVLLAGLAAFVWMARRSTDLSPMFLSEVVLYALSAIDVTMLLVLAFVLVRNVVKMVVERRRALPFARFRAKLVAALLAMTLVPAVLVSIIGSEIIRTSAERWFSAPVDDVLAGANRIAGDDDAERRAEIVARAERLAETLPGTALTDPNVPALHALLSQELRTSRPRVIELYRLVPAPAGGTTGPDAALIVG